MTRTLHGREGRRARPVASLSRKGAPVAARCEDLPGQVPQPIRCIPRLPAPDAPEPSAASRRECPVGAADQVFSPVAPCRPRRPGSVRSRRVGVVAHDWDEAPSPRFAPGASVFASPRPDSIVLPAIPCLRPVRWPPKVRLTGLDRPPDVPQDAGVAVEGREMLAVQGISKAPVPGRVPTAGPLPWQGRCRVSA